MRKPTAVDRCRLILAFSVDEAPIVAADSGRERLDRSRRLLAAMPDRVNLPRIADGGSWIALEDHQIGKLAGGQTPRSPSFSSAAALEVALVIACIGVRPASTISASSRCSATPGMRRPTPESEPKPSRTPASWSAFRFCLLVVTAALFFAVAGSASVRSR